MFSEKNGQAFDTLLLSDVFEKFRNNSLKSYGLLLSDVFEKFRNNSLKSSGLCPSHFLSAPGLSWDAMLKMTKTRLELIPDPDMYIFFKKVIRGGISYISNRYRKAEINV